MQKKIKLILFLIFILSVCVPAQINMNNVKELITKLDSARDIKDANEFLKEKPITVTAFKAKRSAGGIHDYYSEGDYWWPNPKDTSGPYVRRDGMTNPGNFVAHRKAMRRLSIQVATLVAAYKMTGDKRYAEHAIKHLLAWFVTKSTMMNPNLKYSQAIKGITTGRGIGIIDTIHLVEVVQAIIVLENAGILKAKDAEAIKDWFRKYLHWLTTSKFGKDERDNGNNHSTCFIMQVAEYAKLVGDTAELNYCRNFYKNVLLPGQMSPGGDFPKELARTKPYGYSLFNLDAMTMVVKILSDKEHDLWNYQTPDGRSLKDALAFMYPYIKDKSSWPYKKDVMYWNDWPVRQPSLLFGGIAYNQPKYISLWKTLNPAPTVEEIIRNFFIRQPILWVN
jgi:Alginate lyase